MSLIHAATDQIHSAGQLFPFMNFTCSGNITSLMFVGSRFRQSTHNNTVSQQLQSVTSWPYFSLWSLWGSTYHKVMHHVIGPTSPDRIVSIQPAIMFDDKQMEVFRINITSPIPVETGNILGLRQQTISAENHYCSIKVLRQIGGYGFTLIRDWNP